MARRIARLDLATLAVVVPVWALCFGISLVSLRDPPPSTRIGAVQGAPGLSVGVGIATGEDFVGSIRAADRMIWTAIGDTTNLAARLQGLSRALDASLVIDAATWHALDASARRGFERRSGVEVRGRSAEQDVYALPLAGS